jgi:hypothetical protein
MKNKIRSLLLIFACISVGLNSCVKENPQPSGDTNLPEKPLIRMLNFSHQPQTIFMCGQEDPFGIALISGESLMLTFNIKAREGLSQYKIDIHSNFDCHAHRTSQTKGTPWKVLEIVDIEGHDLTITKEIPVPEGAQAGNYHFMLQALDTKGNEADWVLYSLQVQNSQDREAPQIEILSPLSGVSYISKTDRVEISIAVSDNEMLHGGVVEASYKDPTGMEFTVEQYFFPEQTTTEATYHLLYDFPAPPVAGTYTFLIKVLDAVGNVVQKEIPVHVAE